MGVPARRSSCTSACTRPARRTCRTCCSANSRGSLRRASTSRGGPGEPVQTFAVWDLQGRRPRGVKDQRIAGQWEALVDAGQRQCHADAS